MSTDVGPWLAPVLVPATLRGRSVYQLQRATRRGGDWKRLSADTAGLRPEAGAKDLEGGQRGLGGLTSTTGDQQRHRLTQSAPKVR
jgi:hypothetical protein